MTVSAYTTLRHREATAAADSLLTSLSPMENKVRAIVLSDLTINAAQTERLRPGNRAGFRRHRADNTY